MKHRCLRKCGQKFMRRLRTENRTFAIFFRHTVMTGIYRMKMSIGIPCFIKMEIFYHTVSGMFSQDRPGMITNTVIGRIGQCTHSDMGFFILDQRMGIYPFADRITGKFRCPNRPDDPSGIAARDHVNRSGSSNNHRIIQ